MCLFRNINCQCNDNLETETPYTFGWLILKEVLWGDKSQQALVIS